VRGGSAIANVIDGRVEHFGVFQQFLVRREDCSAFRIRFGGQPRLQRVQLHVR
jgi:hypothetical protein